MAFKSEMVRRLPPSLVLPDEIGALFDWMDANGFLMQSVAHRDDRLGLLGTEAELQAGEVTAILSRIATAEQAREYACAWLGRNVPSVEERLVSFARTGGDGAHIAFWRDDGDQQRIVHLGSEGLARTIGETALDLLRLLAVGYHEIGDDCLEAPEEPPQGIARNAWFRLWLNSTFGLKAPATAAEVLTGPSGHSANDPFHRWVYRAFAA